ncbi:hypothetical protein L6164_002139 [Bauhinia variegata]|uniref:Uncharacterized protein n=1 Tax=Bauhinia variegata TaxID=167791 RepID=A0ACB9PX95_BAUVA|nr:hypothetical protein L6164_002139 [Bauhinia variegata]
MAAVGSAHHGKSFWFILPSCSICQNSLCNLGFHTHSKRKDFLNLFASSTQELSYSCNNSNLVMIMPVCFCTLNDTQIERVGVRKLKRWWELKSLLEDMQMKIYCILSFLFLLSLRVYANESFFYLSSLIWLWNSSPFIEISKNLIVESNPS